jgi:hypothetical protein
MNNPGPIAKIDLKYFPVAKPTVSSLFVLLPQHLAVVLSSSAGADMVTSSRNRLAGNVAHIEWEEVERAAEQAFEHKQASWTQSLLARRCVLTKEAFQAELKQLARHHQKAQAARD